MKWTKTENENEATKPEVREKDNEVTDDNVKKGERNDNKGTKPVEVEKIESNGNDAKDNNDPKKLTEDAESKSEVLDEVKTETENENEATKPEVITKWLMTTLRKVNQTITKERNLLK